MALTANEIVTAFSSSGFDAASLAAFLAQAKLQVDLQGLQGKMNNLLANAAKASTTLEEQRQGLQALIAAKQAQIDLAAK